MVNRVDYAVIFARAEDDGILQLGIYTACAFPAEVEIRVFGYGIVNLRTYSGQREIDKYTALISANGIPFVVISTIQRIQTKGVVTSQRCDVFASVCEP